jgi:hypothetical protein
MKIFLSFLFCLSVFLVGAQRSGSRFVMDARNLQKPPVFPMGRDSLQRFYFSHFAGFDSLLTSAINHGDTGRYIRVYFTYVVDENGATYDPQFTLIGSTRYGKSAGVKPIEHFKADQAYYQSVIKDMIRHMPFWKPALVPIRNADVMIPGAARVTDFIQFWVGINPPDDQ